MTDHPKRTPLYDEHVAAGARMVDFAGWSMPVQYAGLMEEHRAVRSAAGLFDVSHMGELRLGGSGAERLLQRATPNDVAKLAIGQAHYSALLTAQGTYIDDLLVYRLGPEGFLVVVNAANAEKDFTHLSSVAPADATVEDVSERYALLALQGPAAQEILQGLASVDLAAIRYYRFAQCTVAGSEALVSRTGYTGEDGFELYLAPSAAAGVWRRLLDAGRSHGLMPAGLGARDTLRLEAGMALYGHEIDETTTPWEAGLDWTVKLDADDFIGRDALLDQRERGIDRRLVGFKITGRGIARQGHFVLFGGERVGEVTSGTFSPTLEEALGMAYVSVEAAGAATEIEVEIRGRRVPAVVVDLPFYRRPKKAG
jgi:aminomethyltransferase